MHTKYPLENENMDIGEELVKFSVSLLGLLAKNKV